MVIIQRVNDFDMEESKKGFDLNYVYVIHMTCPINHLQRSNNHNNNAPIGYKFFIFDSA